MEQNKAPTVMEFALQRGEAVQEERRRACLGRGS